MAPRLVFYLGAMFLLTTCSQGATKKAPPKRCSEFGERCEFAPGKIGACVVRDGCTGDDCLHCQAQH